MTGNTFVLGTSLAMGIYVFGMMGIILGPLLASITMTVFDMYKYVTLISSYFLAFSLPYLHSHQIIQLSITSYILLLPFHYDFFCPSSPRSFPFDILFHSHSHTLSPPLSLSISLPLILLDPTNMSLLLIVPQLQCWAQIWSLPLPCKHLPTFSHHHRSIIPLL